MFDDEADDTQNTHSSGVHKSKQLTMFFKDFILQQIWNRRMFHKSIDGRSLSSPK